MLELLREIADAVEDALQYSDRSTWKERMGMGADGTVTNRVDRIAEEMVFSILDKNGNPLNVLSEEAGYIDHGSDYTLILDPLDGTYNALNGIPFYSISLAVARRSMADVEWALVRNLVSGDEYYAVKGEGAYMNGKRIRTRAFKPERPVFSIFLGKSASPMSLRLAAMCSRIRSMGSAALEICMVASGASDMYCYCSSAPHGGLRVVDIAAASLILREAGGQVLDANLIMLDMGLDVQERASVLAIGDESVLKVIS